MKAFLGLMFLVVTVFAVKAQSPVTANLTVQTPYSVFIADYTRTINPLLNLSVSFNDFTSGSRDVSLRITMESNAARISTKQNYITTSPITLTAGIPTQLNGSDMAEYLNFNNIDLAGISRTQLEQTGRLPEGFYSICVEVVDYETGKTLNRNSCTGAYLSLYDEPIVQLPVSESNIAVTSPQNILFQWQLGSGGASQANNTEYQLTILEILPSNNGNDPATALANNQTLQIYQSPWQNTTTKVYGAAEPQLEIGKLYAYQIQARTVDGRSSFKNDGKSEIKWFRYGYRTGGSIVLNDPENRKGFGKSEDRYFSWGEADNLDDGQPISYKIKVFKINEGQDSAQAIAQNTPWYESNVNSTGNGMGGSTVIQNAFEKEQLYAWIIEGYTGNVEVAQSEIRTFIGPPFIEEIYAGSVVITVNKITNKDINDLAGIGSIEIDEQGSTIEFDFDGLKVSNSGGRYVLNDGAVLTKFDLWESRELTATETANGNATFYPDSLRLDKNRLELGGVIKWNFPLATTSPNQPQVVSDFGYLNYGGYQLTGSIALPQTQNFDLLDPSDFQVTLDESTAFFVANDAINYKFTGSVNMPEEVVDASGNNVSFSFVEEPNIEYFTITNDESLKQLSFAENMNMFVVPVDYTIDLSEAQSPGKNANNNFWKGVYFENYKLYIDEDIDGDGNYQIDALRIEDHTLTGASQEVCWIDNMGWQLKLQKSTIEPFNTIINTFPCISNQFQIDIVNSEIQTFEFTGTLELPFLSETSSFPFKASIENGLDEVEITSGLVNQTFVYNPNKEDLKANLKVKQAAFKDNDKLSLVVDLDWPYLELSSTISNVSDLYLWGDGSVGFNTPNGSQEITTQVTGKYEKSFPVVIEKVKAGYTDGQYALALEAVITLAPDISGEQGPPEVSFVSGVKRTNSPSIPPASSSSDDNWFYADLESGKFEISMPKIYIQPRISVNNNLVKFDGMLMVKFGHPTWGTCFYTSVNGQVKVPKPFDASVVFLLGEKDDYTYWFVELGLGKQTFDKFNSKASVNALKNMALPKKSATAKTSGNKKIDKGLFTIGKVKVDYIRGRLYSRMRNSAPDKDCEIEYEEFGAMTVDGGDVTLPLPTLPDLPSLCEISQAMLYSIIGHPDVPGPAEMTASPDPNVMSTTEMNTKFADMVEAKKAELRKQIRAYVGSQFEKKIKDLLVKEINKKIKNPNPVTNFAVNKFATTASKKALDYVVNKSIAIIEEKYNNSTIGKAEQEITAVVDGFNVVQFLIDEGLIEDMKQETGVEETSFLNYDLGHFEVDYAVDFGTANFDLDVNLGGITWEEATTTFPGMPWCELIYKIPGIDWPSIYLDVGWEFDPNFELGVDFSLPSVSFANMKEAEIDLEYLPDPSVKFGAYLYAEFADLESNGVQFKGSGTLELTFNNSGGLDGMDLMVITDIGNFMPEPLIETVGCMSYTGSIGRFSADLSAKLNNLTPLHPCGQGHLHFETQGDQWKVEFGTEEKPVYYSYICNGLTFYGYLYLDQNRAEIMAGLYADVTIRSPRIGIGDLCNFQASARFWLDAGAKVSFAYNPEFWFYEGSIWVEVGAGIYINIGGKICPFGDFTIAELMLRGEGKVLNVNNKFNVSGSFSGRATICGIGASFNMGLNHTF